MKRKWTDALVKEKVLEVKNGLGLDRMPSKAECVAFFHNQELAGAVSKRGWYELAEELGLPVKESETAFAKRMEAKARDMLRGIGFDVEPMATNFPYDLLVDGCVKVDVKASKLISTESGKFYTFFVGKPYATCDFYILLACDDDENVTRTMVVPGYQVIGNSQISVGVNRSKYHFYTDRFDLLDKAAEFWRLLKGGVFPA